MINSLNRYSKTISSHCLSSEINSKFRNDFEILKEIGIKTKTENVFPDFLYLLWLTKIKSKKKIFYLSDAEKKFQTRTISDSILTTKMSQKKFHIFYSYLFKSVFRDFLKQSKPKTLVVLKKSLLINLNQLPLLMYNKNFFFTILFQNTTYLNIQLLLKFKTNSMPKKLLSIIFFRIIVLEQANWSKF